MNGEEKKKGNPGILDWIFDFFVSPLRNAVLGLVDNLISEVEKRKYEKIKGDYASFKSSLRASVAGIMGQSSPTTPDEAVTIALTAAETGDRVHTDLMDRTFWMELFGLGLIDVPAASIWKDPYAATMLSAAEKAISAPFEFGVLPALRRHYLKEHTPLLPGYGDMIGVYMREGYLEEKWVEIPSEFVGFIKELGFSEFWAYRLWGKHWVLPSVGHLYEMFHKKIIDYDTMAAMLKYHDFEPVWRHRLIENAYTMIPRVDLRRAYMYGIPGFEDLVEPYEKLGYSPKDARTMDLIAKRFALSAPYTRLLTVARAAFRKGQLDGPGFQKILEQIHLPEEAQALIIKAETLARSAAVVDLGEEPRVLTTSQILAMYRTKVLSLSDAHSRLISRGYLKDDADLLLALNAPKPDPDRPAREIVSAASMLYREGWMEPPEFEGWLKKAGLSSEEIQVTIEAQDLRYRLDYARELLAVSREHFRKDLITGDDYYLDLVGFGCRPERAAALVALEEARRLPKPRRAAAA